MQISEMTRGTVGMQSVCLNLKVIIQGQFNDKVIYDVTYTLLRFYLFTLSSPQTLFVQLHL